MNTLDYILDKFNIVYPEVEYCADGEGEVIHTKMPIEIPNFGRDQLAVLFAELGFTMGAEIGVEQGVYSEILCRANPKLKLYSIDAWKAYRGYRDHTRQEKLDMFYKITQARLSGFNYELIRKFSMDAVKDFKDNSLDFVYIDGNHDFLNVTNDIYHWSKKVRPGGIISGHDFVKRRDEMAHVHVRMVLNGYTDAYKIRPWFVLGREAVVEGEIRDGSRSWMWVKQ
jgi:hypothetical protein